MINHYTLFCGVFLYEQKSTVAKTLFTPWQNRLTDYPSFREHVQRTYYPNFAANILDDTSARTFDHLTSSDAVFNSVQLSFDERGAAITVNIPYFDIFLFHDGTGIFAFKTEVTPDRESSYEMISILLNHLRHPSAPVFFEGAPTTILKFIQGFLEQVVLLEKNWLGYTPQLKTYTVIDDASSTFISPPLEQRLFELSHVMPAGAFLNSPHTPSNDYYQKIATENTVSIYANWKAIVLFDSFTRISSSFPDKFRAWEREYFFIYIYCLYTKFKLYQFNGQLKDVYPVSRLSNRVRKNFIEFVNDYNLAYISYKFLPNTLYEKINHAIEIQKELDSMEAKIERLNEVHQEKKSKQLNSLLLTLSLLSIVSVVTDLSQWLVLVGLPSTLIYSPSIATGLWILIGLLAFGYIKKVKPFE